MTSKNTVINTSVSRKNDKVTVTVTETVTTKEPGKEPKVEVTKKVKDYSYDGKDGLERLPEELRKQLDDSAKVDPKLIDRKAADDDFEKDLLEGINKIREAHGASHLKRSDKCKDHAKARAKEIAAADKMSKGDSKDFGEIIRSFWSNDPKSKVEAATIIKMIQEEGAKYDFDKEPENNDCLSFTQAVWKESEKFGAAAVKSDTNHIFVVCAFDPAGNWKGQFKDNVPHLKKSGVGSFLKSLIKKKDSDSESSSDDSGDESDLEEYNKKATKAHNKLRKKHGVPPLRYNASIAKYAQAWAEKLANSGSFEHRTEHKYGENLYTCFSSDNKRPKPSAAVESWYSEIRDHAFKTENVSGKTGHFTQVVWKGSEEVGTGIANGPRGWVVVANYNPPGNMRGSYVNNVPPAS